MTGNTWHGLIPSGRSVPNSVRKAARMTNLNASGSRVEATSMQPSSTSRRAVSASTETGRLSTLGAD